MTNERMLDKTQPPDEIAARGHIGAGLAEHWSVLTHFIETTYHIEPLWKYEGKKSGWGMYWRRSSRALCTLYPERDNIQVMLVLGQKEGDAALAAADALGQNVRECLMNAPVFHDGRWLFIQIQTARDVEDIQRLLVIKMKPPKKAV